MYIDKIMITLGILSDTHLQKINETVTRQCAAAFSGCDAIIHAGDLVDIDILEVFNGKEVHAVCGNMCNRKTRLLLPESKCIELAGYSIAISHGAGPGFNIEERVFSRFPDADCIVFGHTHQAVAHYIGGTLLVNPGSFSGTGKYGAAGTYALLTLDQSGPKASIHTLANSI